MLCTEVEVSGHIIDSFILPKVLDGILSSGGTFEIKELRIGTQRKDSSYARIQIAAPTHEEVQQIIDRLRVHGVEVIDVPDALLAPALLDGVLPDGFYVTTNLPTRLKVKGNWIPVVPTMMDCGIAYDPHTGSARAVKFQQVHAGDLCVVGKLGISEDKESGEAQTGLSWDFMSSAISIEKPKPALIQKIAREMRRSRDRGEKILVVGGPAIVHTGAAEHLVRMIELGFVQVLFAGNALATHDIELSLYGTSLGVSLASGQSMPEGHYHHMRAINAVRGAGSIANAVQSGVIRSGIMHACVTRSIPFVLAGSIRDDGPLPDVTTDSLEAQKRMRELVGDISVALLMGTLLHSIATGNMLASHVKTICVDIHPDVVTKLADRGSHQALGLVTDLEPFLRELVQCLEEPNEKSS